MRPITSISRNLLLLIHIYSDTKLTAKSLVAPITSFISSLLPTPQGRRAIFHLLVPRTRRHFTPAQISSLTETDVARATTSKKEEGLRRDEIRKAASPDLLDFVKLKGAETARDAGGSLVVLEIMLEADGGEQASHQGLFMTMTNAISEKINWGLQRRLWNRYCSHILQAIHLRPTLSTCLTHQGCTRLYYKAATLVT